MADVVFLVLVLGILRNAQGGTLDDPGLGWHIRNIDAMWQQGGWLTQDPFSAPRGGERWYTNQWLGDLLLWLGDRWGGLNGIAAVTSLLLAFTYRCLYGMLRSDCLAWPVAALWTLLAALGSYAAWQARPNIFTLLFLLITARLCERFHRGKCSPRTLLWLLPLFAVWANAHGGFIAGLITLGATTLIEAVLSVCSWDSAKRQAARTRCRTLALVSAGAFLCTLLNPYGWKLYPWILQLLGNSFFMNLNFDWLSPDFHTTGAFRYELLILLLPALLAVSVRKPNAVGLGLSILWLHFALGGQRYVPLWVMVTIPILARASRGIPWLRLQVARLRLSEEVRRALTRPVARPAPWLGSAVVAVCVLAWGHWGRPFAEHNPGRIPTTTLDHLLAHQDGRPVFHHYNWGGYLTWHGWPAFKTWIDDRNEVQGEAHIKEYLSILDAEPGWEARLEHYQFGWVCVPPDSGLAKRLTGRQGWQEVYREADAVLFRRD
jgi:hypothetical protein